MVRVEKVRGNRVNVRGIGHFEIGDQEDVSPGDAEYLVEERGDFEYVDEVPEDEATVETEDATNDTVSVDASTSTSAEEVTTDSTANDDEEAGESDEAAEEATPEDDFSINGWLDNDYEDRADAVLAGGLDDHLDGIENAETSQTVIDAVNERRTELGR